MLSPRTLQAKLLVSVFLIVSVMVTCLTALVIYVEKERFQKKELERIHLKTHAMGQRLGHLMSGKNWRYLMITLSNAQKADESLLYFAVTGADGKVLVSDRGARIGKPFDLSRHKALKYPCTGRRPQGRKERFRSTWPPIFRITDLPMVRAKPFLRLSMRFPTLGRLSGSYGWDFPGSPSASIS